jgi:hypothetical protein
LEIEAKLGIQALKDYNMSPECYKQMKRTMAMCHHWQIYTPDGRDKFNPFKFESSLNSKYGEQARDVFGGLIQCLTDIGAHHNPNLRHLGRIKQKDLIYKSG